MRKICKRPNFFFFIFFHKNKMFLKISKKKLILIFSLIELQKSFNYFLIKILVNLKETMSKLSLFLRINWLNSTRSEDLCVCWEMGIPIHFWTKYYQNNTYKNSHIYWHFAKRHTSLPKEPRCIPVSGKNWELG